MTLRRRVAALLVSLASSIAPAAAESDARPEAPAGPRAPAASTTDQRDTAIRELLETCARAFVPGGRHVRANVMTFNADRTRRAVNTATAFNMDDDPDAGLEIAATAGASGKAVMFRRAAVADLTLLQISGVPPWGLTASEQSRVRARLKSILSVPIFNPANAKGDLLGTVQVDSDLTVEEAGFNTPEAAELMQQFADVLSLLMTGIDVQLGVAETNTAATKSHSRVQDATQVEPGIYVANASTSIFLTSRGADPLV